jgi:predicted regulator of Ras-like GTPase activity (Roadblock/LC7/MglB family)
MSLNNQTLASIMQQSGVTGACLADNMGEIQQTTLEDEGVTELIAFIAGMTPVLAETLEEGEIDQVLLNGQSAEHLMIFLNEEDVLGVSAENKGSILGFTEKLQTTLNEG